MKNPYKSYKMKLTTLSPVFIGSGESLNPGQYVFNQEDNSAKVLDEVKFSSFLAKNHLIDEYADALINFGDKINLYKWLKENRISSNIPIFSYSLPCKYIGKNSLNVIKLFVKNSDGLPYIPGSSIKGAIRTAILAKYIHDNKDKFESDWLQIKEAINSNKKSNIDSAIKNFENKCFNIIEYKREKQTDKVEKGNVFSTLRITDSLPISRNNLYVTKRKDFAIHKETPSFMPLCLEMVKPNTDITFEMSIDRGVLDYFTIEKIKEALNYYTQEQIKLYKTFRKNDKDNLFMPDEIVEDIVPNICLGGHSGYFNKNIIYSLAPTREDAVDVLRCYFSNKFDRGKKDHKHRIYDKEISPHTMKVVTDRGDDIPVGWCNISVEKEIDVSDITD